MDHDLDRDEHPVEVTWPSTTSPWWSPEVETVSALGEHPDAAMTTPTRHHRAALRGAARLNCTLRVPLRSGVRATSNRSRCLLMPPVTPDVGATDRANDTPR